MKDLAEIFHDLLTDPSFVIAVVLVICFLFAIGGDND